MSKQTVLPFKDKDGKPIVIDGEVVNPDNEVAEVTVRCAAGLHVRYIVEKSFTRMVGIPSRDGSKPEGDRALFVMSGFLLHQEDL